MDNQTKLVYMPQLDGLRAVAVAGVLISHFGLGPELKWIKDSLRWGDLGVRLFFVLSGFLITRLLLERRRSIDNGVQSPKSAILRFYLRRILRIFPVFYLTLLLAYIFNVGHIHELFPWHALYLSNLRNVLYISVNGVETLRDPTFAHFWSLAVEEQFYLFWPALVLFLPRRHLLKVVIAMFFFSSLWRAVYISVASQTSGHLPACFDTLGAGALLAFYEEGAPEFNKWIKPRLKAILIAGLVVFLFGIAANLTGILYTPAYILTDIGAGIVFAFVVAYFAAGSKGLCGRIIGSSLLRYLGKISYGIYVYHAFMSPLQIWIFSRLGLEPLENTLFRSLLMSVMTVGIASVSWFIFESPINRLKKIISRE